MWLQTGDEKQWLAIEHRRIQDIAHRHGASTVPERGTSIGLTGVVRHLLVRLGRSARRVPRTTAPARPAAR